MAAKRTISLRVGIPHVSEVDAAAEAITPGHLLGYNSSGDLVKHASSGVAAERMFALERDEMGDDIDVAYAIGDTVKAGLFRQGDKVLVIIPSGQTLLKGDRLMSNGDGRLVKQTTTLVVLAIADEALTTTADTRCKAVIV